MIKIKKYRLSHLHVKHFIRSPAVAEKADRTAVCIDSNSRRACWVSDDVDGYMQTWNFGSSLIHSTFL